MAKKSVAPTWKYIKFLLITWLIGWASWAGHIGVLAINLYDDKVPEDIRFFSFCVSVAGGVIGSTAFVALLFSLFDLIVYGIRKLRSRYENPSVDENS